MMTVVPAVFASTGTSSPGSSISSAETCSDTPANGEAGRRWKAGGEYHGLAARFHLLGTDSREGIYQLRTARVRVNGMTGR